jgi:CRISPR-associated protein Csm4
MRYQVIKLILPDIFRIKVGEGRLDRASTLIHSDTLFSAIVNCYVKLFGEDNVDSFIGRLVISSLFYGIRASDKDILFFPKPRLNIRTREDTKTIKKLEWISGDAFKEIISSFDAGSAYIDMEKFDLLNSRFLISKKEEFRKDTGMLNFIDKVLEPKVSLERIYNTSRDLYFQEELEIKSILLKDDTRVKPFLYFIVKEPVEELFSTLNLLIEEGIGGERSSGKGVFSSWEKDFIEIPEDGNYGILLSTVTPRKEEIGNIIYYELIRRDGFIYHNSPVGIKKRTHFKISEGSFVRLPFEGENIDVSPVEDRRVISYGRSLYWTLKVREDG